MTDLTATLSRTGSRMPAVRLADARQQFRAGSRVTIAIRVLLDAAAVSRTIRMCRRCCLISMSVRGCGPALHGIDGRWRRAGTTATSWSGVAIWRRGPAWRAVGAAGQQLMRSRRTCRRIGCIRALLADGERREARFASMIRSGLLGEGADLWVLRANAQRPERCGRREVCSMAVAAGVRTETTSAAAGRAGLVHRRSQDGAATGTVVSGA